MKEIEINTLFPAL